MVSCNVGLTSALTSLYLFQMPRLGSDIQNLSTGIGLTPSPTRCNIRSDLTVSVIAFFIIFLICHIKYYKKNILLTKIGVGEEYFKDYQGIRYVNPLSVRNIKQNLFYLLDNTSLCNDKNQLPRYKDQIKIIVDKYNILLNG